METKNQKKVFGKKVRSFQFYKMYVPRLKRMKTFGFIWLEDSDFRIRIECGKFFLMNSKGVLTGVVLKYSPEYKKIKRMLAIRFKTFRKAKYSVAA